MERAKKKMIREKCKKESERKLIGTDSNMVSVGITARPHMLS